MPSPSPELLMAPAMTAGIGLALGALTAPVIGPFLRKRLLPAPGAGAACWAWAGLQASQCSCAQACKHSGGVCWCVGVCPVPRPQQMQMQTWVRCRAGREGAGERLVDELLPGHAAGRDTGYCAGAAPNLTSAVETDYSCRAAG
jgi:hypothetical protein